MYHILALSLFTASWPSQESGGLDINSGRPVSELQIVFVFYCLASDVLASYSRVVHSSSRIRLINMDACWILVAALGEISGFILHSLNLSCIAYFLLRGHLAVFVWLVGQWRRIRVTLMHKPSRTVYANNTFWD